MPAADPPERERIRVDHSLPSPRGERSSLPLVGPGFDQVRSRPGAVRSASGGSTTDRTTDAKASSTRASTRQPRTVCPSTTSPAAGPHRRPRLRRLITFSLGPRPSNNCVARLAPPLRIHQPQQQPARRRRGGHRPGDTSRTSTEANPLRPHPQPGARAAAPDLQPPRSPRSQQKPP